MNSTDPTMEIKDENATDYIEELEGDVGTVAATNDSLKVKPKKVNPRQLEKALKIGRNEPCPCGSGKKYKKCHLLMQQEQIRKQQEIRRQLDELEKKSCESQGEEKKIPQTSDPEL